MLNAAPEPERELGQGSGGWKYGCQPANSAQTQAILSDQADESQAKDAFAPVHAPRSRPRPRRPCKLTFTAAHFSPKKP